MGSKPNSKYSDVDVSPTIALSYFKLQESPKIARIAKRDGLLSPDENEEDRSSRFSLWLT